MRVGELIDGLGILTPDPGGLDVRISDLTEDSRTVMPGSLFIARRGLQSDGRRFVPQAIGDGAHAILTDDPDLAIPGPRPPIRLVTTDIPLAAARLGERFYGNPSSGLTVVGVTGTNGKTTTSMLLHDVLNRCGIRCGLIGTVCVDDGVEVGPAEMTTPPAIEISRSLAVMREAGCRAAVIEVSSHALVQARVDAINFNGAIFTSFTGDHLDYHDTMDEYANAKARLFTALPHDGVAIINADADRADLMDRSTRARVIRCSGGAGNGHAHVDVVGGTTDGMRLRFDGVCGRHETDVRLFGAFNAMNALEAVLGATDICGVPIAQAVDAIGKASPPAGRLERVTPDGAPFSVFVDYAHTDDALEKALAALRPLTGAGGGSLCVVFGCGGERDRSKRARMGRVAAAGAERVILTSDNPRSEDPVSIIRDIQAGLTAMRTVIVEPDRERAIVRAVSGARPGDIVLIAGKGHETTQFLSDGHGGSVGRAFDDRHVAREMLAKRGIICDDRPHAFNLADDDDDGQSPLATLIDSDEVL